MLMFRGGGAGGAGGAAAGVMKMVVRYFSRKRAENVRRINPKVPREEAKSISQSLYQIIKEHGPLSVSNTWKHVQEAGVNGLNSKTHMKLMLKWMRGRRMLKLFCTHLGSSKKFLMSTLPEDPQRVQKVSPTSPASETPKPLVQEKQQKKKPFKAQIM